MEEERDALHPPHGIGEEELNTRRGNMPFLHNEHSMTLSTVPNLEITLGRQSWQMEYGESSKELALLNCL